MKTIYIYRGILTEGGCSKIIKDLVDMLHNQGGFDIYLVTHVNSNYSIKNCHNISIPKNPWWMKEAVLKLSNHVSSAEDPTLISFLDHDSNDFMSICSAFLDHKIKWINFNTNHPKIISDWFSRKNNGVNITEEDLYDAVDIIRLENKNFKQYMPEKNHDKCVDFLNTVYLPDTKDLNFDNKLNLLCVNGLRETRKSIIPLIKELKILIDNNVDFKLRVVGEIDPVTEKEYQDFLSKNSYLSNYVEIIPVVENIHDYYKSSDLMVTTATFEGTSNAVLESFANNLPVLCLNYALGLNETIEHEVNGVQCSSPRHMAEVILNLYRDKFKLKELKKGCENIKPFILEPKLGVKKYLEIIDSKSHHNPFSRNKLASYSSQFLETPHLYREKLEALIIYVDLDSLDSSLISSSINSKAGKEAKKIFFICKYSEEEKLNNFNNFISNFEKTEILFSYDSTPKEISKLVHCNSGVEAFLILCHTDYIKKYFNENGIDVICFFDSQCRSLSFLNQYENNLSQLSLWKRRDEWIWLIGASENYLNSCVFNYSPMTRYDFSNLKNLYRLEPTYTSDCGKIINETSLPLSIMKKIRKLY